MTGRKININRPSISSEEIAQGKDFSSLLSGHQAAGALSTKAAIKGASFFTKWFIAGSLVMITGAAGWLYVSSDDMQPLKEEKAVKQTKNISTSIKTNKIEEPVAIKETRANTAYVATSENTGEEKLQPSLPQNRQDTTQQIIQPATYSKKQEVNKEHENTETINDIREKEDLTLTASVSSADVPEPIIEPPTENTIESKTEAERKPVERSEDSTVASDPTDNFSTTVTSSDTMAERAISGAVPVPLPADSVKKVSSDSTSSVSDKKNAITISPFHFFYGTLQLGYEKKISEKRRIFISPGMTLIKETDPSSSAVFTDFGVNTEFQYRFYRSLSKPDSKLSKKLNPQVFAAPFLICRYNNLRATDGEIVKYNEADGTFDSKLLTIHVFSAGAGVVAGTQIILWKTVYLNAYIGEGIKITSAKEQNKKNWYYAGKESSPVYTGIYFKAGLHLGFIF